MEAKVIGALKEPVRLKKITDKLKEPQTMKTVNPISDLKMKRKAGKTVEILKDDLNIATTLIEVTTP